jgi:hypothetical protein
VYHDVCSHEIQCTVDDVGSMIVSERERERVCVCVCVSD